MRYLPIAILACLGCHTYNPAPQPVPEGAQVRVVLSDQGAVNAAAQVGPGALELHGRVLGATADSLVLGLTRVVKRRDEEFWRGERVSVARSDVGTLETRTLSRWRSGLTVAGALTALYLLYDLATSGGIFNSGKATPTPGT